jgi:hypothetical protein
VCIEGAAGAGKTFLASRSLPLAVLITTRPYPSREQLAVLDQVQVRLWLPPMGPMMLERLTYDRTGRWPGLRLRAMLAMAAGNPLFAAELLRAYDSAGALAAADPDLIEARFELDLHGTGVKEVIQAHLAELDPRARSLLAAVAVWGTDIGPGDLARMVPGPSGPADGPLAGTPDGALAGALDRALASGLVQRDPAGTIRFSHDLFREVTYDELAGPQRRELHRRAADVLAAAGYRPSLFAAGDWDGAVAELDLALEQAEETGTGWISQAVGFRCYIDAHRGATGPARTRLDASGTAACPCSSGTKAPAGPSWPYWRA